MLSGRMISDMFSAIVTTVLPLAVMTVLVLALVLQLDRNHQRQRRNSGYPAGPAPWPSAEPVLVASRRRSP